MERNSPLSNCETAVSWIGFAQLPRWCQLGLSTVEVSYHVRKADIGKTLDESLAQPWELQEQGFVLLLDDFVFLLNVLQVLLHGGDLWGKEHGRVTNPHRCLPPTPCTPGLECTAKDTNLGLEFHHGCFHLWVGLVQLTDLLVQLLDLLIVLQNCRREGHRQSTNALGEIKSVEFSAEPILLHCPYIGFYRTYLSPAFFFLFCLWLIFLSSRFNDTWTGQYVNAKAKDSRAVGVQHIPTHKVDCPGQSGHSLQSWVWKDAI